MTKKTISPVILEALTVLHLKVGLEQRGLTVGHLAQSLGGGSAENKIANTPSASPSAGGNATTPATNTKKP
jgi:hypothetical protein